MADISKIKLGSTTYNVKDGSAITDITRSGTTFTATKRDGTTFTFTQQDNNTIPSIYCGTAAATAAKVGSLTGGALTKGYYIVNIVNANTSQTALTLNVNGKGAKAIYINGAASSTSNYTLPAGMYIVYYDGTQFRFRNDGKIPSLISSGSLTTTSITPITKKTVVTGVTKKTVVTGGSTTNVPNVTSAGSRTITNPSFATTGRTNGISTTDYKMTIPYNIVTAVTVPTLGTAIAAYTSLTTGDSVTVSTGDSVTTGTAVNAVTGNVT